MRTGRRAGSRPRQLDRGIDYAVAGSCDSDCTDLDLKVFTAANQDVARDDSTDDVPLVYFRPSWNGRYRVQVRMYRCLVGPCEYRLGVFER